MAVPVLACVLGLAPFLIAARPGGGSPIPWSGLWVPALLALGTAAGSMPGSFVAAAHSPVVRSRMPTRSHRLRGSPEMVGALLVIEVAAAAVLGLLVAVTRVRVDTRFRLPLVYAFSMLLSVSALRIFSAYYWLAFLPAWAWLAGSALELRSELQKLPAERQLRLRRLYGLVAATLLLAQPGVWDRTLDFVRFARTPRDRVFLRQFRTARPMIEFSAETEYAAARYLRQHAGDGDRVFVWGFAPMVQYLSGRDGPTRFMYQGRVLAPRVPPGWREQFVDEVRRARPAFIVVVHHVGSEIGNAQEDALPALREFVRAHYSRDRAFGYLIVYRLRTLER
jgi:hypothetical protein